MASAQDDVMSPVIIRFARVYLLSTPGSWPLKMVRDPSPSTMVLYQRWNSMIWKLII